MIDRTEKALTAHIPGPAYPTAVSIKDIRQKRVELLRHLRSSRRFYLDPAVAKMAYQIASQTDHTYGPEYLLGLSKRAHIAFDNIFIEWDSVPGENGLYQSDEGAYAFQMWKIGEGIYEGIFWIGSERIAHIPEGEALMYPVGFIYDAEWRPTSHIKSYLNKHDQFVNFTAQKGKKLLGTDYAMGGAMKYAGGDRDGDMMLELVSGPFYWRCNTPTSMGLADDLEMQERLLPILDDFDGHFRVYLAAMGMINSLQMEVMPSGVRQVAGKSKRMIAGQMKPFMEYGICRFAVPGTKIIRQLKKIGSDTRKKKRHSVRGHYRMILKEGQKITVWVKPHERGDATLGYKLNDYEVELETNRVSSKG
jgi:hypothetical protein